MVPAEVAVEQFGLLHFVLMGAFQVVQTVVAAILIRTGRAGESAGHKVATFIGWLIMVNVALGFLAMGYRAAVKILLE